MALWETDELGSIMRALIDLNRKVDRVLGLLEENDEEEEEDDG